MLREKTAFKEIHVQPATYDGLTDDNVFCVVMDVDGVRELMSFVALVLLALFIFHSR